MNEDIVNTAPVEPSPAPVEPSPAPASAAPRFSARDWLILVAALGLALLWLRVFSVYNISRLLGGESGPALGAAAVTVAIWAVVLLYLGKSARWTKWSAGLAAGIALLTLACAIYGDAAVRLVNMLLICCGSALCFFSISGASAYALTEARVVVETVALSLRAVFSNWFKPFRALGALGENGKKTAGQVALGVLIGVVLLAVVIPLLASADAVFGSLFTELEAWLAEINALTLAWRFLRAALWTLAFFSAVYFLRHLPEREGAQKKESAFPAAPFVTVLALLDAVYLVFVVIQFAFLFGGAQTAAMEGGYAEYARNGFFQLVWIAAINLAAVLVCSVLSGSNAAVRIMSTVLLALTCVILFSAFWRMRLYILAYGMTLLRASTLWAMAFIAVCLCLAALRIWKPDFRFWPFFAAIGLCGWIIFNYVNIDARIAQYNVDAYLDGRIEEIDLDYLSTLSPDALGALERLRGSVPDRQLKNAILEIEYCSDVCLERGWTDWCLSFQLAPRT